MDELIEAQKWDGECVQKERVDVFVGVCVSINMGVSVRVCVCCMLIVDVQAWRANALGCSR